MNVCIVGLGLIGGSIARDLRESGFAQNITGVDASEKHRKEALELGLIDFEASLKIALKQADLVILAIPVDAIAKLLPEVLSQLKSGAVVTDVGSTKEAICHSVKSHKARRRYVPTHPMAGTENSGPSAALSGLFRGKTAVICDGDQSDADALKTIEAFYRALEMRLVYMASVDHDLHAAYVSHLSHITSFALANAVLKQEKNGRIIFDLAGGGFESTVRLAKSSPAMWTPIFEQNSANVIEALQTYMSHLQVFHDSLVEKNAAALKDLMEHANQIRPVLESIGGTSKKTENPKQRSPSSKADRRK